MSPRLFWSLLLGALVLLGVPLAISTCARTSG